MSRIIVFRDGTVEGPIKSLNLWPPMPRDEDAWALCPLGSYYWHTGDWFKPRRTNNDRWDANCIYVHEVPAPLRAYVLLNGTMT